RSDTHHRSGAGRAVGAASHLGFAARRHAVPALRPPVIARPDCARRRRAQRYANIEAMSPSVDAAIHDLEETRERTLALVAALDDRELARVHSPLMSPLVWDLGHIAA